ncbi:uncharacterized protein LOC116386650 [Anarrhichthys ocellatus]|uniref:uncharacterized protein LOC116386650 n=1 Tax=Anarrhichthys ocellatus TaxID=433405 RepID=UPI0012ED3987|nr:uncharacterized protein LOC116386650 [Anarrhichthys ocellatus]
MIMTENRWIVRKGTRIVHLLFISGFCSFTLGSSDFHLITMSKTYTEAKTYCREMYTDLATVHNSTDMDNLISIVPSTIARAWIGLETSEVWMWHWSWPDQKLDFFKWKVGEPQIKNEDACAAMDQQGEWIESDCGTQRSFVCHGNSDNSGLIFVAETKSWRGAPTILLKKAPFKVGETVEAQFIPVEDEEQLTEVSVASLQDNVDIQQITVFNSETHNTVTSMVAMAPGTVTVVQQEGGECTNQLMVVNADGDLTGDQVMVVEDAHGLEALTVLTQGDNTHHYIVYVQEHTVEINYLSSDLISIRSAEENEAVHNVSASQNVWIGLFKDSWKWSDGSKTSFRYWKPNNLILIQENMTWIEAMGYCREHHIDLVHISSKDIQGKVAETAKNATSLHVWIGLRYTCKFNFWFWTKSTSGCYHNWAPGQGSEGKYDCDVTGAIEATGRQQWVGLPETEKLNFICDTCTG